MKFKLLLAALSASIFNVNAQWSLVTSPYPGNMWTIEFVDQDTGFIGANTAILKTTDGGNSWTSESSGAVFSINNFAFPSATTGYYAANNSVVGKTTDGGTTWTLQDPNASPFAMLGVSFPSETVGYAVGGSGKISKTTDGGTSWTPQSSGTSEELNKVYFFDSDVGIVSGKGGKIKRTTNGGSSWSTKSSGTSNNLYDMYFVDANTGFIAGASGTLLKTTDGGNSWSSLNSGTTEWLYAVCFKNTMEGYAGGADGTILRTTDGGTTWQAESSGLTTQDINDIVYVNNGYIAVANGGKIITNIVPAGVAQSIVEDSPVSVFPNPFRSNLTVQLNSTVNVNQTVFTLYDGTGKKVKEIEAVGSGEVQIDGRELTAGIYFYTVTNNGAIQQTGKVVAE